MSCHCSNWSYNELITSPTFRTKNFSGRQKNLEVPSASSPIDKLKLPQEQFIELTGVVSPVESGDCSRSPCVNPSTSCYMAQTQSSNIGFAYVKDDNRIFRPVSAYIPRTPLSSVIDEAKVHISAANLGLNPLSPTFKEEKKLQKHENFTEEEQAKDLKVKIRVRIAKFVLRGISFGCSLILLAMISTSFSIFHTTKNLPPRNHLPPWAAGTNTWPQTFVLVMACVSLVLCLVVFWGYYRGGHQKAEKVAVYYTLSALTLFIFSSVMWGIAAGILQGSRSKGQNKDLWGWSCVDNKRRQLFADKVNYAFVCRMQNWTLVCCIIEIVLESITILLYAAIFYRFYSKQRLRKSMIVRDRARSDLFSAQIRSQSTLITPGGNPYSPLHWQSQQCPVEIEAKISHFNGESSPKSAISAKPFRLQPAPRKAPSSMSTSLSSPEPTNYQLGDNMVISISPAPGEPAYESVPIPDCYSTHLVSNIQR